MNFGLLFNPLVPIKFSKIHAFFCKILKVIVAISLKNDRMKSILRSNAYKLPLVFKNGKTKIMALVVQEL